MSDHLISCNCFVCILVVLADVDIVFLLEQFSTSAFHRQCWAWTCCARPSRVWARRPCSCWPRCSKSKRSTTRSRCWSCATLVSWPSRSRRSMSASRSTCPPSRCEISRFFVAVAIPHYLTTSLFLQSIHCLVSYLRPSPVLYDKWTVVFTILSYSEAG